MKKGEIILHEKILGSVIDWTSETAFANATQMGAKYGKLPYEFLRLKSTHEYIRAIAEDPDWQRENPGIQMRANPVFESGGSWEIPGIVYTVRGNNGGTWLHPYLAVEFARWCNATFGLLCNKVMIRIFKGEAADILGMTPSEKRVAKMRLKLEASEHRTGIDKVRRKLEAIRRSEDLPGHVAVREWLAENRLALDHGDLVRLSVRLAAGARSGTITSGEKTIATGTLARVQRAPTYEPQAIAAAYSSLFPAALTNG